MAMMHTNFRSVCSVKGHPPVSPQFSSKKLIFRELDRPFETPPKTTRDSTSTTSRRACTPSRVTRLRRLIRLSSSRGLMYFFLKTGTTTSWPNSTSKQVVRRLHVHRAVARQFVVFLIKAHVFSFLLGQIVQGEPGFPCCGRNAAASDASVAYSFSQGSARKFVYHKGTSPVHRAPPRS